MKSFLRFLGWVVFGFLSCAVGSLGWVLAGYGFICRPISWVPVIVGTLLTIGSAVAIVWSIRAGGWNLRIKGMVGGLGLFLAVLVVAEILLNIFITRIMMVIP